MFVYISIDGHRDGRSADFKMAKTLRVFTASPLSHMDFWSSTVLTLDQSIAEMKINQRVKNF